MSGVTYVVVMLSIMAYVTVIVVPSLLRRRCRKCGARSAMDAPRCRKCGEAFPEGP
jgi:ribosomal protein L40E